MRAAALLLLLPACDVVFGLDRDPPAIDAAIDAAPQLVEGEFGHRFVVNVPTGAPMEWREPDREVGLTVAFGNGDEGSALVIDPGSGRFSFPRASGVPYRLIWTSARDGNLVTEWQTSLPNIKIAAMSAGRPDRVPVTQSTPLTFTTPTAPGAHIVLSTGVWSETPIMGDAMDWKLGLPSTPPLGLLDALKNDRLFYVVRSAFVDTVSGLTYTAFAAEAMQPVTIADGVPQNIALVFATAIRDQCAKLAAPRATTLQRVALAAGNGSTPGGDDWIIQAVPGTNMGPVGALTMAFHNEVAPTPATNQIITVAYRNPFPGHQPIATMGAYYSRTITAPTASGLSIATGVRVYTPVAPCPAQTVLDATAGIAGAISLAGVQLTGPDGTPVAIDPNQPATLSWSLAAPGPVDITTVTIYEVVARNGKTAVVPFRQFKTLGQSVTIQTNMLQPAIQYIVRVDTSIGYPEAATGDLETVQYPYGFGVQWSRVFEVTNL